MAITINYTDPETNTNYPECYVRLVSLDINFQSEETKAKLLYAFYADVATYNYSSINSETGDLEVYSPFKIKPYFIRGIDKKVKLKSFEDLVVACDDWLIANEPVFENGTQG